MRGLIVVGRTLRPWLDRLYDLAGGLAALFLIAILIIICLQMAARWTGQQFPGSTDYAGYCMAAASFFALAHAFNRGAHIRVSLLLSKLGRWRNAGELWCLGIDTDDFGGTLDAYRQENHLKKLVLLGRYFEVSVSTLS